MNPKNFDDLINNVLSERTLPSGGKDKKTRYAENPEKFKAQTKKFDAKIGPDGQTNGERREGNRQDRDNGKKPKPGTTKCARSGCTANGIELDHLSKSGSATQNLCQKHHTKVTNDRREQRGDKVNKGFKVRKGGKKRRLAASFDRALQQVLAEADPGERSREFDNSTAQNKDRERHGRKGKGGTRFVPQKTKIKYTPHQWSGKRSQARHDLTLYQHPTTPQVLISPKRSQNSAFPNVGEDFDLIADMLKPNFTYHIVTTLDGQVYTGKITNGDPYGGSRESERTLRIYDVYREKHETVEKFVSLRGRGGIGPVQGSRMQQIRGENPAGESNISVETIEEDDVAGRFWPIHLIVVRKELLKNGQSEFKEALTPRDGEEYHAYSSRVRRVTPQKNLFIHYHAIELNKKTGNFRWLLDAEKKGNISRIAALVPKNMGGSSIDLLGNMIDISVPDWLTDPETGRTTIEPAEHVGSGGILKPGGQSPKGRSKRKRIRNPGKQYLSLEKIKSMREALDGKLSAEGYSDKAIQEIYKSLSPGGQDYVKEDAKASVVRDIAIENFGGDKKRWNSLNSKQRNRHLKKAEKVFVKDQKGWKAGTGNYEEAFEKACMNKVHADKITELNLSQLVKLRQCSVCDGKKYVVGTAEMEFQTDVPVQQSDIEAVRKSAASRSSKKEKCSACNGTGTSPYYTSAKGYQPKRSKEEIDNLTQQTYGIMKQLFQAKCPVCSDDPFEAKKCSECKGSGLDRSKLQTIRKEWAKILRDSLGDDYFSDEDALLFAEKLFTSIANYEKRLGNNITDDELGNDYVTVYNQETISDSMNDILPGFVRNFNKVGSIKWGFISNAQAAGPEAEEMQKLAGERLGVRKGGVPIPYEGKSYFEARRTVAVEKLYGQLQMAEKQEDHIAALKAGEKPPKKIPKLLFFEIRKYTTGKKHFDAEIQALANTDPRLKKMFSELMPGASNGEEIKRVFRSNRNLVHAATKTHVPEANEIKGIGFILSINVGRQTAYEHSGVQAAMELAELHEQDYDSLNPKQQARYENEAYAMRLAVDHQGINAVRMPMDELERLWNETDIQLQTHFLSKAESRGVNLTGGIEEDPLQHRSYSIEYIDIETGNENKMILGPNETINLVERFAALLNKGKRIASKRNNDKTGPKIKPRKQRKPGEAQGRQAGIEAAWGKPGEESADPTVEDILRAFRPERVITSGKVTPSDIARFID